MQVLRGGWRLGVELNRLSSTALEGSVNFRSRMFTKKVGLLYSIKHQLYLTALNTSPIPICSNKMVCVMKVTLVH